MYKILEALLNKSISEITFMKSELDLDNTRSRTKMVDLVVKTKENEVIHVEVNSSKSERTKFRNYCFFSNIISNDTRRAEYYDSSRKYVHIDLTWGVSGNYAKYNYYIQNSEGKRYINNVEIIEANMEYIKKNYYNNERYQWDLAKLAPTEYYNYITTGEYPLKLGKNKKPSS